MRGLSHLNFKEVLFMGSKGNLTWREMFGSIDLSKLNDTNELKVPNEFYQHLLDYVMERSYLNELSERDTFIPSVKSTRKITWMKVMRLPIHPNEMKEYDIISRWQSVLSTLHAWGHRLLFWLQRKDGITNLYLGTASLSQSIAPKDAVEQFKQSASSSMPGIDLMPLTDMDDLHEMVDSLMGYSVAGAVTGIPSFRKNAQYGLLQTLDQLATGLRDNAGNECDFSVLVVADPIHDIEIADMIAKFRKLGSEIHSDVMKSVTDTESRSKTKGYSIGVGAIVAMAATCLGVPLPLITLAAGVLGNVTNSFSMSGDVIRSDTTTGGLSSLININSSTTVSFTHSVTTQYLDKFAKYAEELLERHCERMKKGRNLGFWNVGVYTLGNSKKDITTVMGILRSVYSGDETYIEPIRIHMFREKSGAMDIIRKFELVPLISDEVRDHPGYDPNQEWHIFGRQYQYASTPLNTEELSLATSLPRRDVPGLRFVKTSVRFANNSAKVDGDTITLGKVVDTGVVQNSDYKLDINALTRHALVAGSTGSGKSTTCKTIIREVLDRDIPVLVIEPAKDDYIRWAIEYNNEIDMSNDLTSEEKERRKFDIYMPGVSEFEGTRMKNLKFNPFQPAAYKDAPVDMLTRCEQFTTLLNASLPVSDVLPIIIDEAIYKYLYDKLKEPFVNGDMPQPLDYPKLDGVVYTARQLLASRGYDKKVQDDLAAAIETRFTYLTRGKRGKILNVNNSMDYSQLFSRPAVINVSRIANPKDKALIMSLLMLAIYEYRISAYTYDPGYRILAQKNKLLHLAVVEEAHNLLLKPSIDTGNTGNPQQIAADLFSNILSEIRGYGQGIVLVDQIPTRLVQDAIKNTNYKIVHRLTAPDDCAAMAAGLALREDQGSIIPALGIGDAIICGDMDDAAAWVKMNKPDKKQRRS
jgi:hypothetical protein